jgi:hypothetical protein
MAGVAMGAATGASAQGIQTKSGRISAVFFSSPGNSAFRISLDTELTLCTANFVAVEPSFGNYQAYVSGLLSAQAQNKVVNIVYTVQPNGFCTLLEYGFYS